MVASGASHPSADRARAGSAGDRYGGTRTCSPGTAAGGPGTLAPRPSPAPEPPSEAQIVGLPEGYHRGFEQGDIQGYMQRLSDNPF